MGRGGAWLGGAEIRSSGTVVVARVRHSGGQRTWAVVVTATSPTAVQGSLAGEPLHADAEATAGVVEASHIFGEQEETGGRSRLGSLLG